MNDTWLGPMGADRGAGTEAGAAFQRGSSSSPLLWLRTLGEGRFIPPRWINAGVLLEREGVVATLGEREGPGQTRNVGVGDACPTGHLVLAHRLECSAESLGATVVHEP